MTLNVLMGDGTILAYSDPVAIAAALYQGAEILRPNGTFATVMERAGTGPSDPSGWTIDGVPLIAAVALNPDPVTPTMPPPAALPALPLPSAASPINQYAVLLSDGTLIAYSDPVAIAAALYQGAEIMRPDGTFATVMERAGTGPSDPSGWTIDGVPLTAMSPMPMATTTPSVPNPIYMPVPPTVVATVPVTVTTSPANPLPVTLIPSVSTAIDPLSVGVPFVPPVATPSAPAAGLPGAPAAAGGQSLLAIAALAYLVYELFEAAE